MSPPAKKRAPAKKAAKRKAPARKRTTPAPAWLAEDAKPIWTSLVGNTKLDPSDTIRAGTICQHLAEAQRASRLSWAAQPAVVSENGRIYINPVTDLAADLADRAAKLGGQLTSILAGRPRQADIARSTIEAMRRSGLIDGVGVQALAEMVLGMADAVDRDPDSAAMWREYRHAWLELRKEVKIHVADPDGTTDPITALLERLEDDSEDAR